MAMHFTRLRRTKRPTQHGNRHSTMMVTCQEVYPRSSMNRAQIDLYLLRAMPGQTIKLAMEITVKETMDKLNILLRTVAHRKCIDRNRMLINQRRLQFHRCFRCNRTRIAKGKIAHPSPDIFNCIVFAMSLILRGKSADMLSSQLSWFHLIFFFV